MRHFIGFALALAVLACQEAAPPPATEAGRVLEAVQREGPDSVAHRMDRDDAFGERVLDGIASGDSTWLEVAVALRPTGTAGIAEALPIMVAEALPKAPERVLALIAERRFSIDEVCSIPFIEPSDSLVAAYHAQVSTALARVDRGDLTATRDRCRAALETAHRVGAPAVAFARGAGAQSQSRRPAAATPVGVWRGTSVCLVRPSACNDEIVIYRIARTSDADSLTLDARKIVRGREEEMGVLTCRFTPPTGTLTCAIPRGTWQFRVRNDSLVGELRLTDNTKFRDVRTLRSQ